MTEAAKSDAVGTFSRAWRFLCKPWHEKSKSAFARWSRIFPNTPGPLLLASGVWWIVRDDHTGPMVYLGQFECDEVAFVNRFLKPGMTVLDLGAHHGYYTLLSSKLVGPQGRVFAFEPSPRERKALRLHVRINLCWNVRVQGLALGEEKTEADLHVVAGGETGCNSLRPPRVVGKTAPVRVRVTRLDDWLGDRKIGRVDFIKLDVEGAELDVLKGASGLLQRRPRPVILAEVQDVRTLPWGYRAKEIIDHLRNMGYTWFRLSESGCVQNLDVTAPDFEGNFVAWPEESLADLKNLKR
jgi:FkbM family methyltransferase